MVIVYAAAMSENSLMDKLAFAISILTSTVAFFIIGAISYATFDGYGLTYFSWHPPLMSIGVNKSMYTIYRTGNQ